jgi:hypothetical protein
MTHCSKSERPLITIVLLSLILLAVGAGQAGAVEFGSRCTAAAGGNATLIDPVGPEFVIPTDGIITQWGSSSGTFDNDNLVQLITVDGGLPSFTITGISEVAHLSGNGQTFFTRLKARSGERIGLTGAVFVCPISGPKLYGVPWPETTVGTEVEAVYQSSTSIAVWARVEKDADNDGYGDETQDFCPQNAKWFSACPPANADARVKVAKSKLTVTVPAPGLASVQATGRVRLPPNRHGKVVKFMAVPVSVENTTATLSVNFPKSLQQTLKRLNRRKTLKVRLTVRSIGPANTATKKYTVKLRGRKK